MTQYRVGLLILGLCLLFSALAWGAEYTVDVLGTPSLSVSPSSSDTYTLCYLHYGQTPSMTTQIQVKVSEMPSWLTLTVNAPSPEIGTNQGPVTLTTSPSPLIINIDGATDTYWTASLTYYAEVTWEAPVGLKQITVYYILMTYP